MESSGREPPRGEQPRDGEAHLLLPPAKRSHLQTPFCSISLLGRISDLRYLPSPLLTAGESELGAGARRAPRTAVWLVSRATVSWSRNPRSSPTREPHRTRPLANSHGCNELPPVTTAKPHDQSPRSTFLDRRASTPAHGHPPLWPSQLCLRTGAQETTSGALIRLKVSATLCQLRLPSVQSTGMLKITSGRCLSLGNFVRAATPPADGTYP